MKKYIFPLIILFQLLAAEGIEELSVVVYPEYYYPGVMVEFTGVFEEVNANKTFSFMIPTNTDSVFLIKEVSDASTNMTLIDQEDRNGESWVSVPMNQKEFRVFAFYVPFNPHDVKRSFDYTMKFEDHMENVHLVLNHPAASEDFQADKPGAEPFDDQHGLQFSRYHIHDLAPNTAYTVNISYSNPSMKTSIEYLQEMLSAGGNTPNTASPSHEEQPPKRHHLPLWAPIFVLFGLFAVVGFLFYKNTGRDVPGVNAAEPQKTVSPKVAGSFCSACGTKMKSDAKFCHSCGEKV